MTSNTKIIANAVCGKTARPCDCCIKKRARWYCTADDAFLCQGCDGSVHSANPLAWRHERVRLKTASLTRVDHNHNRVNLPSWHWGLTRKTRTPRHAKHFVSGKNPAFLMVPELGGEDTTSSSNDCETEDGVLHRVPILDPFEPELSMGLVKEVIKSSQEGSYQASDLDDLKEFAADVETLLGKGLDIDAESYGIADLRFFEYNENTDEEKMQDFGGVVKEENELANAGEIIKAESDHVAIREPFDLSFVYDENFPTTCELGEGQKVGGREEDGVCKFEEEKKEEVVERKKISLRLDYGAISDAWACQGSPWMNGQRPLINLDDSWPHCLLGALGGETRHQLYGEYQIGGMLLGGQGAMGNGGREARVSRYREKRRTRLFSKKIRYEVRKLNAQKRPRMKGRFVKRSSFPPTSTSFHLLSK